MSNEILVSFVIPVYNRSDEILELLQSFTKQSFLKKIEIVIIEDGSTKDCTKEVAHFSKVLSIKYFFKPNSGPGDSRNFGALKAKGKWLVFLDSDCILDTNYIDQFQLFVKSNMVVFFGGPDAAHLSFTKLQKAINYTMTSPITTGGIRGRKKTVDKYQPRSFNMGILKEVFLQVKGFGNIHPGEDPELSFKVMDLGIPSHFAPNLRVFHKRRTSWALFYKQVRKFGLVRPILSKRYPQYKSIVYAFPTVFCLGLLLSIILALIGNLILIYGYVLYTVVAFLHACISTKNISIGFFAILALWIQFWGYGMAYLESYIKIFIFKRNPETAFPKLFFPINKLI